MIIGKLNINYGMPTGGMSINMCRAGKYPLLFIVSGMAGTIMTISLSSLIAGFFNSSKSKTLLAFISNGTIVILGFHMMVNMFVIKPLFGISNNLVTVITISILNFLICIIIVMLCNRFFPILLGNRK